MIKAAVRTVLSAGVRRLPHGPHVTRYAMYAALKGICADGRRGAGKRMLAISHSGTLAPILGIDQVAITEADYPEHSITDLSAFPDGGFDFIVSDQVLEHIEGNPQIAFDESLRVLKPGGIAVHTTCFINPIHDAPADYWRFTPEALRYLARGFGEIVAADGWGNRAVWLVDAVGLRMMPIPHAPWHPLHRIATRNDAQWPVVTWIVARK